MSRATFLPPTRQSSYYMRVWVQHNIYRTNFIYTTVLSRELILSRPHTFCHMKLTFYPWQVYKSLPDMMRTDEADSCIRKMIGKHIRNAKYRAKCKQKE